MSRLTFTNCRHIGMDNYKTLAPVFQEQMTISSALGFGTENPSATDFIDQSTDGDPDAYVELWDVVETANPDKVLYDAWIYLVDTANVFHHGTANDTGVGMIQFGFVDINTNEETELALDMQEAFENIDRS
jgi:hypothetical protein